MYKFYNPNPHASRVGDCSVRAVSKALNQDWETTFVRLMLYGFCECDMPSANNVWGKYLHDNGFVRRMLPDTCPSCYTVEEFASDHPHGTYVLAVNNHVVTLIDGDWYDTWNSKDEVPLYYWIKDWTKG